MSKYKTGQVYLRRGFHYLVKGQSEFDDDGRLLLLVVSVCSKCGHYYEFNCLEGMFHMAQRKRCDSCKQPGKKAEPWPDAKQRLELIA